MSGYTGGSVSAKITLDTSEFKEAVEQLKGEVKGLKTAFNILKGDNPLADEVKQLKEEVKSLQNVNKDYKKALNDLRKSNEELAKSSKKSSDGIKKQTEAIKEYNEAVPGVDKSTRLFRQNFDSIKRSSYLGKDIAKPFLEVKASVDEATVSTKRFLTETGKAVKESIKLREANGDKNRWGGHAPVDGIKPDVFFNTDWENIGFGIGKKGLQDFLKIFADAKIQVKRDANEIENAIRKFASIDYVGKSGTKFDNMGKSFQNVAANAKKANEALKTIDLSHMEQLASVARKAQTGLRNVQLQADGTVAAANKLKTSMTGFAPVTEKAFTAATKGAEKFKQRLAEIAAQTKKTFETLQVELAKANAAQYKYWQQSRGSVSGFAEPLKIKGYNDYLKAANAVSKYNIELEKNIALERKRRSALAAKDNIAYSMQNFQAASQGMALLNKEMQGFDRNSQKTTDNVRNAGQGLTSFNNGVVQTAHSGRILSNTLYQIRGALLSLKMIFTAMGGMMLWGFAMDIAEGIKTTFTAKNELEAQLRLNSKVGETGLKSFNRALDETISKFQKVNKYQLGETISSLGIEFELSAKQMEKAMPVVAMIQSEYIRAGRTSEEAALAVKDILQGEFQRLSRETGVGKEELVAYGWDEDKTNIEGLLDAVKKAGEDRNWDVFAAKATSLNDVIEITKNRFEEFGADLLQSISPIVVSGFNTIIDSISGLKKTFDSLGSFGKNALLGGGAIAGVTSIVTLLPMITKGMGLAEIATLGWSKSIGTAVFNLNKAEVAQYGFRKALAAVITGTKASEVANVRTTKAIMGRLLGVKQSILAEHGYATALVQSKARLLNHTGATNIAKINSMSLAQKMAYLTNNMKLQEAQALKTSTAIRKTALSWKVLGTAIKGAIAIGIVAWYASMATWADTVKKNIENLNEVIENGDELLKKAEKNPKLYDEDDIKKAVEYGKVAKRLQKQYEDDIAARKKKRMEETYKLAGMDDEQAKETYYRKAQAGWHNMVDSINIYDDRLYKASQHMNEHVEQMKAAGASQEKMTKYIDEYSAKAEEVAENWKKFNQGDMGALLYAAIGEIQLAWIDLWNDKYFVEFWESVKKTWRDLQPTIREISKTLGDLGHGLLQFFTTDTGKMVGGAAIITGAIVGIGIKIAPTLKKLKDLGGSLKDVLGKLKDWKRETGTDTSKDKSPIPDETTGDLPTTESGKVWKKGEYWKTIGNDAKNIARDYLKAATHIAMAMVLVTEAIALINLPMGALAATGWVFKQLEPNIRKGIEGLKLVAPVIIALLVPTVALMTAMSYFKVQTSTLIEGFKTAAAGVALGIVLVTEAIVLLNAPLIGLAILGSVYGGVKESAQQGIKAMQVVNEALSSLVIWIPVFAAGIALAAVTIGSGGVGGLAILAAATGIAIGIGLVTEAILLLAIPLETISELGTNFPDLSNAKQGADALKVTAEAMGYVGSALADMVKIQWEDIKTHILDLSGIDVGDALNDLVKEEGFFSKLNQFMEKLGAMEIKSITDDKVTALQNVATGMGSIGEAMKNVKAAIDNLPDEFKNGGTDSLFTGYNSETGQKKPVETDTSNYFDQFKEPLEQLGTFVKWFNEQLTFPENGVEEGKLETITQASSMIGKVKEAVDNIKAAMQGTGDAAWAANMAEGGIGQAVMGWLGGLGGSSGGNGGGAGVYTSSLGSSFDEMEKVITDIVTFNNRIGSAVGDGGEDNSGTVNAMANMVTAVDQAIQSLSDTLSGAVPTIQGNAKAIGTGIYNGLREGMGDLSTPVIEKVTSGVNAAKPYAYTYGKGLGGRLVEGFKAELKIQEATQSEIETTLTYLDGKKQSFYDRGKALGENVSSGYKAGQDINSPGIMARATFGEIGYIEDAFDTAINTIPAKAQELGASLADNYSPQLATDVGLTDMTAFEAGLANVGVTATNTDLQTTLAFNNMNTTVSTDMQGMTGSVNGAFNNIKQNTTASYTQLTNTTRTSLNNMQSQTTKNINAIRTSWRGMQDALIASAESIRSQTSQKIGQLESNMASFWRKIQNPANLLAGGTDVGRHTTPRNSGHTISRSQTGRLMAGNSKLSGISNRFSPRTSNISLGSSKNIMEYLSCLLKDGFCMAGGWHFNWSKDIQEMFLKWHTHFGEIYDSHLTVGKFENDDFPVRGIAEIAKKYIYDAISRTTYEHYYNYKYGSPLAAWNAGHFNCVEGASIAIALANAFGFGGGHIAYGTWDGEGHGFAVIPGLGVIDATAIQGGYGFKSPKVTGYPAGSHTISRNSSSPAPKMGNTIEGDVVFEIHIDGDVDNAEEKGRQIAEEAGKKFIDMFRRSPSTGL